MTILNLGLGLDTSGAKKELDSFHSWLKGHAPSVSVSLDIKAIKAEIESLTALPVINLRVNSGDLKKELKSAVDSVFKDKYTVLVQTDALTKSIHDAASAGLKGLKAEVEVHTPKVPVPQAAPGAVGSAIVAADSVNVATTIKQFEGTITTAVRDAVAFTSDMMAKSFQDVIANQSKKDRVRSNVSASQSITTPEGIRVSKKVPITEETDLEAINEALRVAAEENRLKAIEDENNARLKAQRIESLAKTRDENKWDRHVVQTSQDAHDPKLSKDAAFAAAEAQAEKDRQNWDSQIENEYNRRASKLAEEQKKLKQKQRDLEAKVDSEVHANDQDASNQNSIAALRERQRQQFEAVTAGMDEHRRRQLEIERSWNERETQQSAAHAESVERAYVSHAKTLANEKKKAAEELNRLADKVVDEIHANDQDASNPNSVAALRERQRQQFDAVTSGMDEHRRRQLEIEQAWNAREAQEAVNRTKGLEKAADQMAAARERESLSITARTQKEDAGQRAALEASRLAEQVKTARGIYNGAKTDMSRMLNEQGSSIAALAVLMQKMPSIDPTSIVNNPVKIEQANQLNKIWAESGNGSQRAEEFMARYIKTTAKATDGQTALNKAVMEYYRSAKFDLAGQDKYTSRGVQIGAAAQTVKQFGPAVAGSVIGNASLITEAEKINAGTASLAQYHKATSDAAKQAQIMRQGLNDAHSAARGLAGSLGMVWLTWGQTVPLAGMAAIGFSLRQTYQVGKDVEYQLKFVQALTGGAAVDIDKFNEAVRGTMVAPVDAAKALRGLAQNGLESAEALQALPTILKLATAGEMGLSEAALGATGVMAAFNLGVSDLGRVADVFSYAAAKSNTSVGGMVEAMKQASTVSDQYGVSLEETASSLAVLAKRNIEGSAAGTAFRNMMTELAAPSEKARKALESMGLQIFDGDKKLKGFKAIMEELRGAVIRLDQQSRINFLNQIFDERGAKAANALLSDMGLLREMLSDISEKSAGFTDSINGMLNQSVEGSIKGLVSDFQQTAITVFKDGSESIKAFIGTLRDAARSEEFKSFLRSTGELILNVTQFLVEHAKTIGVTVAAWLALRGALAGFTAVTTLIATFKQLEIGLTAVKISALATWGALTGGIAIVVTLAAEYLLLRDNTSEAQKAHENFQASMSRNIETMAREIEQLQTGNELLDKRNRLMAGGMSPEDAKKATEGQPSTEQEEKMADLKRRQDRLNAAKSEFDTWSSAPFKGQKQQPWSDNLVWLKQEASKKGMSVAEAFNDMTRAIDSETMAINVAVGQTRAKAKLASEQSVKAERNRILTDMFNLQKENEELAKGGKTIKAAMPKFAEDTPIEDMRKQYEEYKKLRNSELDHKMAATREDQSAARKAQAEADRLRNLQLSNDIKAVKAGEDASRDATRQAEQISKARFDPAIYGESTVALLAEIEAQENLTRTYTAQADAVKRLEELKKKYTGKEEIEKIQEQINEANRQATATAKEIETYKQVQKYKSENRVVKNNAGVESMKSEQDQDFQRIMREITQKRDNKFSASPLDTAEAEARAKVEEADANRIISLKRKIATLDAGRLKLESDIQKASDDELPKLNQLLNANNDDLSIEKETLRVIIEQSRYNAKMAGDLARKNEEYARSWEGGWDQYWRNFREGAVTNAKIVNDVMNTTTSAMTDMFTKFVTTGKMDFKSFARTIMEEAARLMASKAVLALLNMAANLFFAGSSTPGVGTVNGSAGTPTIPANVALKGGVHPYTPGLPGLPLQKFRAGGVSFGPTYTLHAEGARSEAYVPLEDGRNIPVKIVSQPGSGSQVIVNTTVNVTGDGKATATTQASNEQGAAIAKLVEQVTVETIIKQQQPGGVLYGG